MKRFLSILFFISTISSAQVGGESIYNFLNLTSSARQASLGGKVYTLIDDIDQPNWNPSVINNSIDNQLSINYLNYISDINLLSASFAHMFNRNIGTFHTNVSYLNYGKFIGTDENGVETSTFKAYDFSFSLGYSYNIHKTDFFIGGNLKLINSVIENYSSFGIGADVGILFYNEYLPFMFTLVGRNIGYQISVYDEEREDLPFQVDFGASYKLENVPITWHFTFDNLQKWKLAVSNPSNSITDINGNVIEEKISFFDNVIRHFSVGAELFAESSFNLRFGYNFRRAKELMIIDKRTFAGFTAGFGLKMNKVKFNYAFSKYHPASNTSTFSLHLNLN